MPVVICGGGIISATTAYFLAKLKIPSTIIEQSSVACAASGKAGGFLARNWCDSSKCEKLAHISYDLHMEFAKLFDDVDYRKLDTYSGSINKKTPEKKITLSPEHSWIDGPVTEYSLLDTKENTAQVHPKKLCFRLIKEAKEMTNGATKVVIDTVVGMDLEQINQTSTITSNKLNGPNTKKLWKVRGVKLQSGRVEPADKVLIAMGPWSHKAIPWFPKGSCLPQIFGHRAHSIILSQPSGVNIPPVCLFLQYRNSKGISSPEIYPRPDQTVYLSGYSDEKELPEKADDVAVERWRCTQLREVAYATCSGLEPADVIAEQACYLPMTMDGIPAIGKIPAVDGAFVATGHSCWGILNSTGTGLAIAELMITGKSKRLDLTPFDPARFSLCKS